MADENNKNTSAPQGGSNYQTLSEYMSATDTLLTNIQNTDIWDKVKGRGYETADITAAQDKLARLRTLDEAQKKEYGEQYKATEGYEKAQAALHEDYIEHLGYARLAFKGDISAQTAMGLGGKRKVSQSGYADQGSLFYNNALNNTEWKTALGKKGIDETTLTAMRDGFKNLGTLSAVQKKETGEAQEATKKRDTLYDELHEWTHDLRETAKLALRKYPQMMEQLGIKDPS